MNTASRQKASTLTRQAATSQPMAAPQQVSWSPPAVEERPGRAVTNDTLGRNRKRSKSRDMALKKIGILLSYSGKGYYALEKAKGQRTIEGDIITALETLGLAQGQSLRISRSGNTVEGGHAARQVLSLEIIDDDKPYVVDTLNQLLPEQIRIWGLVRTVQDFSARRNCDSQTWTYWLPTYSFIPPPATTAYAYPPQREEYPMPPPEPQGDNGLLSGLRKMTIGRTRRKSLYGSSGLALPGESADPLDAVRSAGSGQMATPPASPRSPSGANSRPTLQQGPIDIAPPSEQELLRMQQYRASPQQLDALQHMMGMYRGSHNWHNYVRNGSYEEMGHDMVQNVMCSPPEYHNNMEWVRITFTAANFHKYQILKMVALAVLIIRTNTPRSIVANSFGFANIDIPEAPAYSLVLEDSKYDGINGEMQKLISASSTFATTLGTIKFAPYNPQIEEFKQRFIYEEIFNDEAEIMGFEAWMRTLDKFSFLYHYLNPRGVLDLSEFQRGGR
ncbi:hypothetical protein SmJEL517_g03672 [Synchytrium microbalum]|uniref:Pseudouridine synthase I TruA alpha/beta domain-containing protein n=1 Tax=Synchytrium microbalum TaxID=1806994 RepID=A0A507BXD6_9FUNG|nr:uncharacterized protein SmJEL517_g03672 [Synchytrium microbalum]TPX33457.1 hypothetical protein SmJEL517_g03672 [Synchytrium microbalum]